jgi:hypothetical protein
LYSRLCLLLIYCPRTWPLSRHLIGHMPDRHQTWAFCTFCVESRRGQCSEHIFMIYYDCYLGTCFIVIVLEGESLQKRFYKLFKKEINITGIPRVKYEDKVPVLN